MGSEAPVVGIGRRMLATAQTLTVLVAVVVRVLCEVAVAVILGGGWVL